jgi:hypothetical protein
MFATFVLNVDVWLDSTFEEVLGDKSTNFVPGLAKATLDGHLGFLRIGK